MKRFLHFIETISLVFIFQIPSQMIQAQESAERSPTQSWQKALGRQIQNSQAPWLGRVSAVGASRYFQDSFDVSDLPEWAGTEAEFQDAFEKIRDEKRYVLQSRPDFPRRAPWLYPRDGCFTRAAHSAKILENSGYQRPGKVFAFGNLWMKTEFDAKGVVYWSYHVAAAYRVGDQALVLDPSVNGLKPLLLKDWVRRISSNPFRVRVAICDSYTYFPGHACWGGAPGQERGFESQLRNYLPKEWNQLIAAHKNPEKLLGSQPPWSYWVHPSLEGVFSIDDSSSAKLRDAVSY